MCGPDAERTCVAKQVQHTCVLAIFFDDGGDVLAALAVVKKEASIDVIGEVDQKGEVSFSHDNLVLLRVLLLVLTPTFLACALAFMEELVVRDTKDILDGLPDFLTLCVALCVAHTIGGVFLEEDMLSIHIYAPAVLGDITVIETVGVCGPALGPLGEVALAFLEAIIKWIGHRLWVPVSKI